MGRKSSQKNERKINKNSLLQAREQVEAARKQIKLLKMLTIHDRPDNYATLLRQAKGVLSKSLDAMRKSETHSISGKGSRG